MRNLVNMATVSCYKNKEKVLSPSKVVPGKGDFEVPELPRMQWLPADDSKGFLKLYGQLRTRAYS